MWDFSPGDYMILKVLSPETRKGIVISRRLAVVHTSVGRKPIKWAHEKAGGQPVIPKGYAIMLLEPNTKRLNLF